MGHFKDTLIRLLNKLTIWYTYLVVKIINFDDITQRKMLERREAPESNLKKKIIRLRLKLGGNKLKIREQVIFLEELYKNIKSGSSAQTPFLYLAQRQNLRPLMRLKSARVAESLKTENLVEAIKSETLFDKQTMTLIEVSQGSNDMVGVIKTAMNNLQEKEKRFRKLKWLLMSPIGLIFMMIAFEIGIAIFFVPMAEEAIELSSPTLNSYKELRVLLLQEQYKLVIYLAIAAVGIYLVYSLRGTKLLINWFALQTPVLSTFIKRWELLKFFDAIKIMLSSGSSAIEAVETAFGSLNNEVLKASLKKDIGEFEQISMLAVSLNKSIYVEPDVRYSLLNSYENKIDIKETLENTVDNYKSQVEELLEAPMRFILPAGTLIFAAYIFSRLLPLLYEYQVGLINQYVG